MNQNNDVRCEMHGLTGFKIRRWRHFIQTTNSHHKHLLYKGIKRTGTFDIMTGLRFLQMLGPKVVGGNGASWLLPIGPLLTNF